MGILICEAGRAGSIRPGGSLVAAFLLLVQLAAVIKLNNRNTGKYFILDV